MSGQSLAAALLGACVTTAAPADLPKAGPSPADKELVKRLDCLINMPGPRPGIASDAFRPFLSETRKWLAGADAQDALFRGLPTLTTPQLVTLWDVLWFPTEPSPRADRPRDMDAIAAGFSRRFNDAALAALAGEKDAARRRVLINMIKPQAHTLTEKQAADFLKAGGWKEQ